MGKLEKKTKRAETTAEETEQWLVAMVSIDQTTAELKVVDEKKTDNLNKLHGEMVKALNQGYIPRITRLKKEEPSKKKHNC